jgi:hypothetical protein
MDNAMDLEARLYHRNRVINQARVNIQVRPIEPQDFLCLVLDNAPEDYGFLGTALFGGNENIRLHRETLTTARLGLLADYPQCYTGFDVVIMGDIDPSRIAESHQDLLRQYVAQGGVLVVCTGSQKENYQGTWVEDLLGVKIGTESVSNELAIAQAVFSEEKQTGTSAERTCAVAELTPATEGVQTLGDGLVLATLRRYGSGYAAAIALDSKGKALHGCEGYHDLWRDLCNRKAPDMAVSLDEAAQLGRETLIGMAGVELLPKSVVVTYLLLYFFVGIVANWIFWSLMKRREMAWVCLIIFSFGFTTYAIVFGTAGRAERTEVERLDVLRLPAGADVARLDAIAGILTAGTGQYAGTVPLDHGLIRDFQPDSQDFMMNRRGLQALARQQPFIFTQTDPPRFDELQIGASDMRLLHVNSMVSLDGGIEGEMQLKDGQLRGTFLNETGLPVQSAALLHEGTLYPLVVEGNKITLDQAYQPNLGVQGSQGFLGTTQDAQMRNYQGQFLSNLLQEHDALDGSRGFQQGAQSPQLLEGLSPCIVAWVNQAPATAIQVDGEPSQNLESVLLLARVNMESPGDYRPARFLPFELVVDPRQDFGRQPIGTAVVRQPFSLAPESERAERWLNQSRLVSQRDPVQVNIKLPAQFMRAKDRTLWVELFSEPNPAYTLRLTIAQSVVAPESSSELTPSRTSEYMLGDQRLVRHVYNMMPWVNAQAEWQQDLVLNIALLPNPQRARVYGAGEERRDHTRVGLSVLLEETGSSEGAIVAWK